MTVTIDIPEELLSGAQLAVSRNAVERTVLEALAIEAYRSGRLTESRAADLLGFEYRFDLFDFLAAHNVDRYFPPEELDRELAASEANPHPSPVL